MARSIRFIPTFFVLILPPSPTLASWEEAFLREVRAIDQRTAGNLGVYAKRLSSSSYVEYQGARKWYLSSLVKVPVAIALLQKVDEKQISLDQRIKLGADDKIDGQGPLLSANAGDEFSVRSLLEFMLAKSDSSAADLVIQLVGESELNERLKKMGFDFGTITSLRGVRQEAYGELHPSAKSLTNADFMRLRDSPVKDRHKALLRKIGVSAKEAKSSSVLEAFEKYYRRGLNSGSLLTMGAMLERMGKGELLSKQNANYLLSIMEQASTGEHRIKAGLPKEIRFAQKTGTQINRMCAAGLARPAASPTLDQTEFLVGADSVVVVACLENFGDQKSAEQALRKVGIALAKSGALPKF